jgi:hypothetical protein
MVTAGHTLAQSRNLAPGFTTLPKGAKILIVQPDIELFLISGGGVLEPKADWTEAAHAHVHKALIYHAPRLSFFPRHQARVEAIAKSVSIK